MAFQIRYCAPTANCTPMSRTVVSLDGGLITWKSEPAGIIQGRKRLPSMNMIFGAIFTVSMVICTFFFVSIVQPEEGIAAPQVLGTAWVTFFELKRLNSTPISPRAHVPGRNPH